MKKSVVELILLLLLVILPAQGQDTLAIATYNVLNYPGGAVPTARDPYLRAVLLSMKPDVLVVQEMTSQTGMNNLLSNVLNAGQPGAYSAAAFNDGWDSDNGFFYKPSKVTYISATYISPGGSSRDIAEYRFKLNGSPDTLRIFSLHIKAGNTPSDSVQRYNEAVVLRNYLNALPAGSRFIVAGDFNIYRSAEGAFQKLIGSEVNNNGRLTDPLNAVGVWNNNYSFRFIHTQSPRVRQFGGGSYGGMDDRFDMQLHSSALSSSIIVPSYKAYGNDGNHFNDSINRLPNSAVPDSVANGLHYGADHIPVIAKYVFQNSSGFDPEPTLQATNVQFNTVTSSTIEVTWTNGNGAKRIVVARAGSAVSFSPSDGQSYSADNNFASATDLGSGNKAVFSGSSNSLTVTGLNSNTTYHFAVYEFNGSGGTENYLTTSPAINNQATLTTTYYSQGNFAPNLVSSWNSDRNGFGSSPTDFTSGVPFVVQGGDTMITTAPWTVSGTGNRIQIENGGMLQADHLVSTAAFQIDNGGTYVHNAIGSGANGATTDLPGTSSRSFGASSTVQFNRWGVVTGTQPIALPSGLSWGNLIINVDTLGGSWQQSAGLTTVTGNLSILRTGGGTREFRLNANSPTTSTLTLTGDLLVSGGIFSLTSGTAVEAVNFGGNFLQTGGTFTASATGPHSFSFVGGTSSATFASTGGTFTSTGINWIIALGKTLTLNGNLALASGRTLTVNGTLFCGANSITGAGGVTVSSDATLGIESPDGINSGTSLGNIRVTGARTFDAGANYLLDGAVAQVTGNGFPASIHNLTVNNSGGVTLTNDVTVNGVLGLTSGGFSIGAHTLTLNGNINKTAGSLSGGSSSSITFGGSGASTDLPAVTLQNLSVNKINGISIGGPLTVVGTLTVTNGSVSTGENIITLGPSATINEPVGNAIEGTLTTTRTVSQSLNNTFGGIGIEVNATSATPGSTVVTRQTGISSVWNEQHSILRYFDISPDTNANLNATMVFHYETTELNGHNAASLKLWKSTDAGISWQLAGGTVNTTAKTITLSGITGFSRWTASDSLHFSPEQVTTSREMSEGWNIVSVPVDANDYRRTSLYPASISSAFTFVQSSGYVVRDTLKNGLGYWLKFPLQQTVNVTGSVRAHDTLSVLMGWNLVGSTSVPVAVTDIQQVPTGIVTSPYYQFFGNYAVADTVRPMNGYWVKVNQNGRLILR